MNGENVTSLLYTSILRLKFIHRIVCSGSVIRYVYLSKFYPSRHILLQQSYRNIYRKTRFLHNNIVYMERERVF